MGEVRSPFELVDLVIKPPLKSNPIISDDIQQVLATLVGFDGTLRHILRSTPTGILQTVNPIAKKFINIPIGDAGRLYQGADIRCSEVLVRAHPENTDKVWVNIYAVADIDVGWLLKENEHIVLTLTNLSHLHLKLDGAGDKAMILYTQ